MDRRRLQGVVSGFWRLLGWFSGFRLKCTWRLAFPRLSSISVMIEAKIRTLRSRISYGFFALVLISFAENGGDFFFIPERINLRLGLAGPVLLNYLGKSHLLVNVYFIRRKTGEKKSFRGDKCEFVHKLAG